MTFYGGKPKILPMDNWMVANTVSISKTDEVTDNLKIETVATHPMYKTELESFVIDSKSGEKKLLALRSLIELLFEVA